MKVSVSIDKYERSRLLTKVKEQFVKMAKARDNYSEFKDELTKAIYLNSLEQFKDWPEEQLCFIPYVTKSNFKDVISSFAFPKDVFVYGVGADLRYDNTILYTETSLTPLDPDSFVLPDYFKAASDKNLYPLALNPFEPAFNRYNALCYSPSSEELDQINAHNEQMLEVFKPLEAQLQALVTTVSSCKSTKSFEAKLPNLVNLYPDSVKRKLREKNADKQTDTLTDEEKLLQDATASLAAATLLGD